MVFELVTIGRGGSLAKTECNEIMKLWDCILDLEDSSGPRFSYLALKVAMSTILYLAFHIGL